MAPNYSDSGYGQGVPPQGMNTAYHPPQSGDPSGHGINMRGYTDTRDQVQARAEQNADREIDDAGFFPGLILRLTRDIRVNDQVNQEMGAQAQALTQGVELRQAPVISTTNYMSYDHATELKPMVTDRVDPGQVGTMGSDWIAIGNGMIAFQRDFANAISRSEPEWRGEAGDRARKFMVDVANYIGKAGQSAALAGTQQNIHSTALTAAKNGMPEPVPFDAAAANRELQATTDPLTFGIKYAQHMMAYQASQDAHQQAAQVLSTYDQSLGGASVMPAFPAPPSMSDSGDADQPKQPDDTNPNDRNGNLDGGTRDRIGDNVTTMDAVQNGDSRGGIPQNPSDNRGPNGGDGNTSNQGHQPRPPAPGPYPGSPNPGGPFPGGTNPSGTNPGNFPGGNPPGGNPGPLPGGMSVGPMGPGGLGGLGGDTTRGGGGAGGGGAGGRGGFGPGGGLGGTGGGAAGGAGAGGRAGFGPGGASGIGALAAEQAAGRGGAAGAAGRAGGVGMGGMGGMGAGRGQGGEDSEHQRASYLIEPDPDDLFGSDQKTAPPVIG